MWWNNLGVHEHWNNPTDKQYSRNLGMAEGIALVKTGPSGGNGPAEGGTAGGKDVLIAYFSRSGNTETIAKITAGQAGGNLLRVQTASPYPRRLRRCFGAGGQGIRRRYSGQQTVFRNSVLVTVPIVAIL